MRSRNREVNIFNMSLLDILTGMMGAFLFLMLGLVPYYTKVKAEQQNPQTSQNDSGGSGSQQGPQVDALLQVTANWNSSAKINIYLYESSAKFWDGANAKNPLLPHHIKISDASSGSGEGWESTGDYVFPTNHYLLILSIPPAPIPAIVEPASYSALRLTSQLTVLNSKANSGGVTSFSPRFISSAIDTSEMKPGHSYAVLSFKVSRDESKAEYYQQYSYEWDYINPATDQLPPDVIPIKHPWK